MNKRKLNKVFAEIKEKASEVLNKKSNNLNLEDRLQENSKLKRTINYFENLFDRLVNFIKKRIFGKENDREDYINFSKELYEHGIFSDKTITDIKEDYNWSKEYNKNTDHDDFDLEI